MKYKFLLIFFFALLTANAVLAQEIISGQVLDSVTRNPLAFVNITTQTGDYIATTDISGSFKANVQSNVRILKLSYVGYFPLDFNTEGETRNLLLFMSRQKIELSGVEIYPEENPAHKIINKAIENKKINNPENIASFKYQSYNKVIADWYLDKTKYNISNEPDSKLQNDSTYIRLKNKSEESHIMIMESYTERIFLKGQSQETVLGSKVSGFSNPNFTTLATDIQPFSFYGDFISLSLTDVKDYINPVSKGSLERYHFLLKDTLYVGNDSVFVIEFEPMKGRHFDGLKGVLYINSNRYAIQNVIAQPADEGLWNIKIQQMYAFVDNKYWFPVQLNYDWILPNYPSEKVGVALHGNSYISNIDFDPGNKNRDFGPGSLIFEKGAGKHDEEFWKQHRTDSLTALESRTYLKMDSLGKKAHFNYISRLADKILQGYIPLSIFDFDLEKLFNYNNAEGVRIGLGVYTNEKVLPWFTIGGYVGYGVSDLRWKYGGKINFTLSKKHEIKIGAQYSKDLEAPGETELYQYLNYSYWNDYLVSRVDFTERYSANFSLRTFKYLQAEFSASKESLVPQYPYQFGEKTMATLDSAAYNFTEFRAALRFAYREKLIDAFNDRYSLGTKFPVLYLTYIHGFKGILGGQYDYNKLEFAFEKSFTTKYFGKTDISLEAGALWNYAPYMKLFKGKGSYSSSIVLYLRNTFQTMRVDEFLYDRYISLQLKHSFGSYLFRIKKFKPEISLSQGILFGNLTHPEYHSGVDFRVPNRGFYESGVIFDNLVRVRLLNLAYLKIGFGVFYRYGAYAYVHEPDNFEFKVSLKIAGNK